MAGLETGQTLIFRPHYIIPVIIAFIATLLANRAGLRHGLEFGRLDRTAWRQSQPSWNVNKRLKVKVLAGVLTNLRILIPAQQLATAANNL